MTEPEQAYLSILDWPEAMSEPDRVQAASQASGLDPYMARQRVIRGVPVVLERQPAPAAARAVESLRHQGVLALAPTESQFAGIGKTCRLKSMAAAEGAPEPTFLCTPWRSEPFGLRASELFMIIRARTERTQRGEPKVSKTRAGRVVVDVQIERNVRNEYSEIIDLYTRSGRWIRINGDKFNFDVLGADRGYSDLDNATKLAVWLAESAPRAMVDTGFRNFHCPIHILRASARTISARGMVRDSNDAEFDFYSAWIYLVHRALLAG